MTYRVGRLPRANEEVPIRVDGLAPDHVLQWQWPGLDRDNDGVAYPVTKIWNTTSRGSAMTGKGLEGEPSIPTEPGAEYATPHR
jgi:hypothetical protein